jgi:fructose transport system permease protein
VIAQQTAVVGTLAIGQSIIVLTAGIDLSCAQIMVFAMMVMAKITFRPGAVDESRINGFPPLLAILIGILVATGAGLVNGALITRLKLPPFIVTLGTWGVFQSLTLVYATGRTIQGDELTSTHLVLGNQISLGGFTITIGVVVMVAMYLIYAWVTRNTAWGRHIYAVGDDPDAARLAGIISNRVILSAYAVAGVIFGIAGWILMGRIGSAGPNSTPDGNLDSITAVVIGGISLFGGRGRIMGALLGAMLVNVVSQGLTVTGINQYWKPGFIGVLIIGAVAADQWIRKARA